MPKKKDAPTVGDLDLDLDIPPPPGAPHPGPHGVTPIDLEVAGVDPNEWGGEHVEEESGLDAVALTSEQLELLATDPKRLEEVYVKLPAQIALQGKRLARITAAFNVAKGACKSIEAALDPIHRRLILGRGEKPTADTTAAAVTRDPRLTTARAKLAKLDEQREEEWAIMEGLRAKLSTSIAIGQVLRAELVNEPRIKDHAATK